MKSEINKNNPTEVSLTIVLESSDLESARQKTFDQLRPKVKAAGFRPGKAPDHVVEKELGANEVQSEVLETAIGMTYFKAVDENKLIVIANPKVNIRKFVPYTELEYVATVEIMPEIKLPDYSKIKKDKPEVKVTPKEVQEVIAGLQKQMVIKKATDRPSQKGDEVVLDIEGLKDGQRVEQASGKNRSITLGAGVFLPDFEDQVIGMIAGNEKEFEVTMPKDYQAKDLAGQKVHFKVKVHKVHELELPKLNEAFAKKVGPFKNMDEVEKAVASQLDREKQKEVQVKYELEIIDAIVAKSNFNVPKSLVDQQIGKMKEEISHNLANNGLTLEKYLELKKQTPDDLDRELAPEAEKNLRRSIIVAEIGKQTGINVSEDELQAELNQLKATYTDEKVLQELEKPEVKQDIHNQLLGRKTIAKILEQVEK